MNVPKLRFKEFNDEWQLDKISNLTTYVDYRGKTPTKTETGIFLVTAKNVKKGYIDYNCSKEYVEASQYNDIMHRGLPQVGDVLITTEAPCGNVAQIDNVNVALAQRIIKYRGKDLINNTFLKYELLSDYFQTELKKVTSGGTVSGVKGSVLHQMNINYCSKDEQKKISEFLSLLDKKIELQTKKIEDLKLFTKKLETQYIFKNQVEYPKKRIDDVFSVKAGGDINKNNVSFYKTSQFCYPIYSNNLEMNGLYGYSDIYKINEESITVTGRGDVGKAIKRDGKYYPIVRLLVLIPKMDVNLIYMQEAINNLTLIQESTGVPQLTAPQISRYEIPFPPLYVQEKYGKMLSLLQEKIIKEQRKVEVLQQLKKGLMQNMFV